MCTRISHVLIFIFHFDVKPPSLVRNQIRGHSSSADPAKRSPSNQYLKKHKSVQFEAGLRNRRNYFICIQVFD